MWSCHLPDWLRHFQIPPLTSAQRLNLVPGEVANFWGKERKLSS
jgi:hypothetical protein